MKKIYFHKCRIKSPHPGYKDCPCENIVIDWDNIKLFLRSSLVIIAILSVLFCIGFTFYTISNDNSVDINKAIKSGGLIYE